MLGCSKDDPLLNSSQPLSLSEAPIGFPKIPFPEDNPYTVEKWKLGKKLFYDPILSYNNTISCGSCHAAELAFADTRKVSLGVENRPGTRNSPSLANIAYHPYFTREGGVPTLEMQVLVPIQEHNEMSYNIVLVAERLSADSTYSQMSRAAFGRNPDPYVITRAIATFERTLISGNSLYDEYISGTNGTKMSASQKRGMELFFSDRTKCGSCHEGFNFTNYAFENNGLYERYPDSGRFRLTNKNEDFEKFKVPSLRNVALTGPYMHDGSVESLEEVVQHYNNGGKANPNKNERIKPLKLSKREVQDLVSFLESLTDYKFITNENFQNEFE